MSLKSRKYLFVDCQTTGIRPPAAHLLEIAWSVGTLDEDGAPIQSHLVRLPEGQSIPRIVTEITGLTAGDLADAVAIEEVARKFAKDLEGVDAAIIHYAQFEKPFLLHLLKRLRELDQLPFRVLCTHQITKRLFPNLPSQNIRACAGFFGPPVVGLNRAATFVRATMQIWGGLSSELEKHDLRDSESIEKWLAKSPRTKATRYEYRLDKVKRLELPDSPGVYRMLAKTGEVLYVGKATSLKSRVNSYFRGKKGRDLRKLEMLAQVWDLQITPCPTPLEAALLESDEIKRLNPPYNVVLKTGNRHLQFYSRDFTSVSRRQSAEHPVGPFRNSNWIDHLRLLSLSVETGTFQQVFIYEDFPEEDLREGFRIFCEQKNINPAALKSVRCLLAYGMKLYREYEEPEEIEEALAEEVVTNEEVPLDADVVYSRPADDSKSSHAELASTSLDGKRAKLNIPQLSEEDLVVTPEDLAGKFERLLRRAAAEKWRTKKLTKLLNAKITIDNRTLEFHSGRMNADDSPDQDRTAPWSGLEIDTYDRMSILLSELTRSAHSIERH